VLLAFAAWAFGIMQARAAQSKSRIVSVLAALIGAALAIALLTWPFAPIAASGVAVSPAGTALHGEPYTPARLAALQAEKRPVLVNLTAAWCITCLYNERVALSSAAVADAFKQTNTAYLVGDWTNRNADISALLRTHGREGVPLYLYFAPGESEPKILPQILTETIVTETLKGNSP
jgi:thiol:disulfide interchange protein